MGKIREDELLRILVEQGLLSGEQARDCAVVRKKTKELGLQQTVLDIAVQKGYLTEDRRKDAVRLIKSRGQNRPSVSIPGYEILEKIGEGGMGTVYRGVQVTLERPVAIKILAQRLADDEAYVQRFLREARSAARIDHRHVVRAIDAGESSGTYYFVMEFVPGRSLKEILKERGPLAQEEGTDITAQIADALTHAEKLGIVHRDIKPDNIMITPDGTAKLSDLGLAREVLDLSVTMAGNVIGTPHYMSPEQIRGLPDIDVRSDIYSLGATLFQMLTNEYPFRATTPTALITKHIRDPRPDPAALNPAVSKPTSRLVRKMMARDRKNRPQSAEGLKELIEQTQEALRVTGERAPARAGRRQAGRPGRREPAAQRVPPQRSGVPPAALIGGGAAVLAIIVIAALVLTGGKGPQEIPRPVAPVAPPATRREPEGKPPVTAETTQERPRDERRQDREQEAARKAAAIRAALDERLSKTKARADEWIAKGRFKEAEHAYLGFLKTVTEDPWKTRAEKEMAALEEKALQAFRDRRMEIDRLVARRDFAGAHDMFMDAMGKTTSGVRKTMAGDLRALERQRREAAEKRAKMEAVVTEARREALQHVERGRLPEVIETYRNFQSDRRFADAKPLLAGELKAFRKLQALVDRAESGAVSRIGEKFSVQGIAGTIAGAGGGSIRIASGGAELTQPLLKLKTSEILDLAGLKENGSGDPLGVAMLYVWRGETDRASRILEQQKEKGTDVSAHMSLLEEVERRHSDSEARKLVGSVQKLVAAKQWTKAHAALTTLKTEYSDTEAFAEARKSLGKIESLVEREALRTEDAEAEKPADGRSSGTSFDDLNPIPGMAGKIRRIPGRNGFRAEYTFDDEAQLADWGAEDAGAKENWSVKNGSLIGKRGGITHKIPFTGDILVEAKVLSSSRFALQIGEYRFEWYPYASGGTRVNALRHGTVLPGGRNYLYHVPPGVLQMRWVRKKNVLTWYCWGNKAIIKTKDWGTAEKDSTVRIEQAAYSSILYGTIYRRSPDEGPSIRYDEGGDSRDVRIEEITIRGSADDEWLRGVLRDAIEKK